MASVISGGAARGKPVSNERIWPAAGETRLPYWVYSDPGLYALEQERIFCGPTWNYVALEAEIPKPGDFKRTFIGDKSVVVVRDGAGGINVLENRCAHRGAQFCQRHLGNRAPRHGARLIRSALKRFLAGTKDSRWRPATPVFSRQRHPARSSTVSLIAGSCSAPLQTPP